MQNRHYTYGLPPCVALALKKTQIGDEMDRQRRDKLEMKQRQNYEKLSSLEGQRQLQLMGPT